MLSLGFDDLIAYTNWERQKWRQWFRSRGDEVLAISAGPHGDGRFHSVGELVRYIFSAEKRYVERLSSQPLTDTASIPSDSHEALFQFGELSRKGLLELVTAFPAQEWDVPQEFNFPNRNASVKATPKKIVIHVLMHEIRHWAQIATVLRLNGLVDQPHDFLFSPVMGGDFKHEDARA
jgi:uncharacterized damage-inducible protein DinB